MRRRRLRKIAVLVVLTLLLGVLGVWYLNFRATKSLKFDFVQTAGRTMPAPSYLYSFNGAGANRLKRPVGVLAIGETVYVSDSQQGQVYRFSRTGGYLGTFGKGRLLTPLYIAQDPKTGHLFITDRGTHAVVVFTASGQWVREFKPNLPKKERPAFETNGIQWMPIAIGFAPDGTLYVSDILKGHRLLVFGPDGKFQKSVGIAGMVNKPLENPTWFQFPNSIKVHGDEVWVTDSNNRRIQVFERDGTYKRIVPVGGLPRGFAFLNASKNDTATAERAVVVDTLAHDATIWSAKGERIVSFGQRGILEGQFNYPGDISVGPRNVLFISDTVNERVQAWGWPAEVSPVPTVTVPPYWWLCLTPLLLLPIWLLARRKRRFVATADFVEAMVETGNAHQLPARRREWLMEPGQYERVKGLSQGDVDMAQLFEPMPHSESDANALMKRLELDHESAVILSVAQRARVFATEDTDLRRVARLLDIDVVDRTEFLARFGSDAKRD